MPNILKKIGIESQIDDFMDQVSESGLLCKSGIEAYLKGNCEAFDSALTAIRDAEHRGDMLRKTLENDLYAKTLIPESRGDVMELLESMDALLGRFNGLLWQFDIEKPQICQDLVDDFRELLQCSVEAVEATVRSAAPSLKTSMPSPTMSTRLPTGRRNRTRYPRAFSAPSSAGRISVSATRCICVSLSNRSTGSRTRRKM